MKNTNDEQEAIPKPPLHQWIDYYKAFGLGSFWLDEILNDTQKTVRQRRDVTPDNGLLSLPSLSKEA